MANFIAGLFFGALTAAFIAWYHLWALESYYVNMIKILKEVVEDLVAAKDLCPRCSEPMPKDDETDAGNA